MTYSSFPLSTRRTPPEVIEEIKNVVSLIFKTNHVVITDKADAHGRYLRICVSLGVIPCIENLERCRNRLREHLERCRDRLREHLEQIENIPNEVRITITGPAPLNRISCNISLSGLARYRR